MASFQEKIGGEWSKKSEKKKNVPISSYLTLNREFQKNRKKIQKI